MSQIYMQKKVILLGLLVISLSMLYFIQKESQSLRTEESGNLGFKNQTGSGVSKDEINNFALFISAGGNQFRDDTKGILQYIYKGMQNYYGNSTKVYDIMLMTNDSYYRFELQTVYGEYGALEAGVDKIHPSYSYLFASHQNDTRQHLVQNYISIPNTKGKGIDKSKEQKIKNLILQREQDTCAVIQTALGSLDGQRWTVVCTCSSVPNLNLLIFAHNDQWIYTKPKNCYYGLYVSAVY